MNLFMEPFRQLWVSPSETINKVFPEHINNLEKPGWNSCIQESKTSLAAEAFVQQPITAKDLEPLQ